MLSLTKQVLDSPCSSYWLRDAIIRLMNRDIIDAARDAEILAQIMRAECDRALKLDGNNA